MKAIDPSALDQLFFEARTHRAWTSEPVTNEQLRELYALARLGPTSANTNPMRLVFVRSPEAKERLKPCLDTGNVEKMMTAPVTAIVAYDVDFHKQLHKLNPAYKEGFDGMDESARDKHAAMNAALSGAYLIIAVRALGLDCGAMGGFNAKAVDREFFGGTFWRSSFLLNIGHGDASKLRHPRSPRLSFDEAARII